MCHVLIIQDEPLVAMSIEDLLALHGATSFAFASTQQEAVAAAMAHKPSVITSDVKLLEGAGPAAGAQIHERMGPIRITFITGTPELCTPCNPPGSILEKPFTDHDLRAAFRDAIAA